MPPLPLLRCARARCDADAVCAARSLAAISGCVSTAALWLWPNSMVAGCCGEPEAAPVLTLEVRLETPALKMFPNMALPG